METNRLIVEKLRLNPDADPTDGSSNPVESDGVFDALALKANSSDMTTALGLKLNSASYTASDVLTKIKTVDGTTSGLDADLLDGYEAATAGTVGTVAVRDGSGDITARLFRSTYAEQTTAPATTADIAFRVDSTTDNYIRFMSSDAIKAWLTSIGVGGMKFKNIASVQVTGAYNGQTIAYDWTLPFTPTDWNKVHLTVGGPTSYVDGFLGEQTSFSIAVENWVDATFQSRVNGKRNGTNKIYLSGYYPVSGTSWILNASVREYE